MKFLTLLIFTMFLSTSLYAQHNAHLAKNVAFRAKLMATVLESRLDIVSKDAQKTLSLLVADQDYEVRTSLLNFNCRTLKSSPENGESVSCAFAVGTDDLSDDDNGWGSIEIVVVLFRLHADGEIILEDVSWKGVAG